MKVVSEGGAMRIPTASIVLILAVAAWIPIHAQEDPALLNGDANGDGTRDISDAVYLLAWLFTGGSEPLPIGCEPDPINDLDGDGITDRLDNCPTVPNPGQEDRDLDGYGDACDQGFDPGSESDTEDPYANWPAEEFKKHLVPFRVITIWPPYKPYGGADIYGDDDGKLGLLGGQGGDGSWETNSGLMGDEATDTIDGHVVSYDNYFVLGLGSHSNAGSTVRAIEIWFGDHQFFLGAPAGGFKPGQSLLYDFNDNTAPWLWEEIDPDDWDTVRLITGSGDGIQVERVEMVHSSEQVLDTTVNAWLDKRYGKIIDFSIDIAMKRWERAGYPRTTILYYASQDLGQTGSIKYVNADEWWCSEFVSYHCRMIGLDTPAGAIGVTTLKTWFEDHGRGFSKADVEAGKYRVKPGDYFSVNPETNKPNGTHSVIFREWANKAGTNPANGDRYRTIEGNHGNAVTMCRRDWDDVAFIGTTQ
jgi:hypothetical protein